MESSPEKQAAGSVVPDESIAKRVYDSIDFARRRRVETDEAFDFAKRQVQKLAPEMSAARIFADKTLARPTIYG